MKSLWILIMFGLFFSCGNKKQTLEAVEKKEEAAALNTIYESEVVLDSVVPSPGIKYKPTRIADPNHPPVTINLATTPETGELDLADYYSTVKYLKLKHPLSEQDKGFLGDADFIIMYDRGMSSGGGINSEVYLTGENIIAGDKYFGYHCYDAGGNYVYTLAAMSKLPGYDSRKNEVSIEWDESLKMIHSFSVHDNNCLIYMVQANNPRLEFHNIQSRKTYMSRPFYGGRTMLLSPETFISYQYNAYTDKPQPFMYSYDMKGDTLCQFINHNSLATTKKGSSTNPDRGVFYYYNGVPAIRQAYNDTIYRMTSPKDRVIAYILDSSSK